MTTQSPFIVSADWLEAHLDDPGMAVVDASWYLPAMGRNARAEYEAGHIPRAVFFDQDEVVEPGVNLPHAMPSPAVFQQYVSGMGISRDDTIVVYDGPGFFSAPRVWWLFRTMGARNVFVLDGGLDGWKREGRKVTATPTKCAPTAFVPHADLARVVPFDEMQTLVASGTAQIADARGPGRFTGDEPEPREGMRSGHMPGARNVHYATLSENGYFKDANALRAVLESAGIDPQQPVVATCGSGVTAAVVILALETLGNSRSRLFDGSWAQWGSRPDTPVVTGPAT